MLGQFLKKSENQKKVKKSASQAEGRGFEPHLPLNKNLILVVLNNQVFYF